MYINYPIVVKEITAPCVVHSGKDFYIRAFPLDHTKVCVGYTLEEMDRPGEFHPEKARELGVPCGPLWAQLQAGFEVKAEDINEIGHDCNDVIKKITTRVDNIIH